MRPVTHARRSRLTTGSLVLGVAMGVCNVIGYLFVIVVSRALSPAEFGAFSALNTFGLLLAIPAGAFQVVVARRQASDPDDTGVRAALATGGVLFGLALVASPALADVFHLGSAWAVALVAGTIPPMLVTGAAQGVLLGRMRFAALASVYVVTAITRLCAALFAWLTGVGVVGVVGAMLVASVVSVGWSAALTLDNLRHSRRSQGFVGEIWRSNRALAALLALSSIDVILARHYLSGSESGAYALAALFGKVVFWGTQFLALSIVPALQHRPHRRTVLGSSAAVLGLGVLATAVVAASPHTWVRVTGGSAYSEAAGLLVGFTLLGTLWALAQVALFAEMSVGSHRLGVLVLVATVVEVLAVTIWFHDSAQQILLTAAGAAASVVVVAAVHLARGGGVVAPEVPAELTTAKPAG